MNIFPWKMSAILSFTFQHFKFLLFPLLTHSAVVMMKIWTIIMIENDGDINHNNDHSGMITVQWWLLRELFFEDLISWLQKWLVIIIDLIQIVQSVMMMPLMVMSAEIMINEESKFSVDLILMIMILMVVIMTWWIFHSPWCYFLGVRHSCAW